MTTAGEAWLEGWQAQPLEQLTERIARWGADEPASWAESELESDIAQTARFLVLRELWEGAVAVRNDAANAIDELAQKGALTRERIEVAPNGDHTGRDVGGLHESLMETAPGGAEAAHEAGWY
jgi:hypothetical protein